MYSIIIIMHLSSDIKVVCLVLWEDHKKLSEGRV